MCTSSWWGRQAHALQHLELLPRFLGWSDHLFPNRPTSSWVQPTFVSKFPTSCSQHARWALWRLLINITIGEQHVCLKVVTIHRWALNHRSILPLNEDAFPNISYSIPEDWNSENTCRTAWLHFFSSKHCTIQDADIHICMHTHSYVYMHAILLVWALQRDCASWSRDWWHATQSIGTLHTAERITSIKS